MTNVTVIGTGNMGAAIAGLLAKGGADIAHVNTSSPAPAQWGDIVVLAVPYSALPQVVSDYGPELHGKILVDITNPVDFEPFGRIIPSAGSAAEELAAGLPGSRVIKAFNTNFAATLASSMIGTDTPTVLLAGDDAEAKLALAGLISAGGVVTIDAGPLVRAQELESLAFLQIALALGESIPWTGGFSLVR